MAQILVRDLDDAVVRKLKARARSYGRSLQSEVKAILTHAASSPVVDMETARRLSEEIRRRSKGRSRVDSAALLRQERDR